MSGREKNNNMVVFNQKSNYILIDILKFICAIFVVGIHAEIMNDKNDTMQWYILHMIFRIAVPFFFIASGFLYGKKVLNNKNNLKEITLKQIKRLIIPFVFWLLISLPYQIIITTGENIFIILLKVIRSAIFYPWGALWFMLALVVAIMIEYWVIKQGKLKWAMIISFVLYGICLLGNSYYFILEGTWLQKLMDLYLKVCVSTRNGIFEAFPIFTVGVYIATKEKSIENIKNIKIFTFLIIALLIQAMEVTYIRGRNYADDHSLFIMTIFVALLLLILCIKYKNLELKFVNGKLLRNLSTGIYFMHAPIIRYTLLFNLGVTNWQMFFITIILIMIICLILYKVNNKYINYVIK